MYKKKLEGQLEKMEQLQDKCDTCDISEFLSLAREILHISKKIDEFNASEHQYNNSGKVLKGGLMSAT